MIKSAGTNVGGLPEDLRFQLVKPLRPPFQGGAQGINRVVYDVTSKPPGTIERE